MGKLPTIQEAELALKQAKEQDLIQRRQKELGELIKDFQGKCFGTHTFDRSNAATYSFC